MRRHPDRVNRPTPDGSSALPPSGFHRGMAASAASPSDLRAAFPCGGAMRTLVLLLIAVVVVFLGWLVLPWRVEPPAIAGEGDPTRGEYVLRMGGCVTCHTAKDGPFLAGGRAIESPYGTFYAPNITPDPRTGISGWSNGDFIVAMTEGRSPEGYPYYPAFPYTSFGRMTEQDLLDLKAYLDTVEPVENEVPAHDLDFPATFRFPLRLWQLLYLENGPFQPDPSQDELWNRGAYLVRGPSHCGECHTPRGPLGASIERRYLAGQPKSGPDGEGTPNITPHQDGIGDWSKTDITFALQTSILPDGDVFGGAMAAVVDDATSHLEPADLEAIATYLMSIEPKPDAPAPSGGAEGSAEDGG
jgi:mono/diheme cytochrome c family protein